MNQVIWLTTRFFGIINDPNCTPKPGQEACADTVFPKVNADAVTVQAVLQIVFGVIAVSTVIFIIISAIRYSTSLGDPKANERLRNSIIYSGIGLIVALSAEAIVTFILGKV